VENSAQCPHRNLAKQTYIRDFLWKFKEAQNSDYGNDNEKSSWQEHKVEVLPDSGGKDLQLRVRFSTVELPYIWLRDHCRCHACVNQETMQRALDTFSIPENIAPSEVVHERNGLRVTWANDGHLSFYSLDFLHRNAVKRLAAPKYPMEEEDIVHWGSEIKSKAPSIHYDEVMASDNGVGKWTSKIKKYGFCYVDGCPIDPTKTKELLERIAFIRVTHYGGFYDFTSDLTMKDTAYTSQALPAHTDTAYFTDPARLQMFHLLSHTEGTGGESLLVDGWKAADTLRAEDSESWRVLGKFPVHWHSSGNNGVTITSSFPSPVMRNRVDRTNHIRWNNDDRATLGVDTVTNFTAEQWYVAARKFNEILKREDMEYWAQLEPGRPLIFDNWRVLHGRSAFAGKRRMCGGYINNDDYISRWRNTNFTREEAIQQVLEGQMTH